MSGEKKRKKNPVKTPTEQNKNKMQTKTENNNNEYGDDDVSEKGERRQEREGERE